MKAKKKPSGAFGKAVAARLSEIKATYAKSIKTEMRHRGNKTPQEVFRQCAYEYRTVYGKTPTERYRGAVEDVIRRKGKKPKFDPKRMTPKVAADGQTELVFNRDRRTNARKKRKK